MRDSKRQIPCRLEAASHRNSLQLQVKQNSPRHAVKVMAIMATLRNEAREGKLE
jgi:hypothetical protein